MTILATISEKWHFLGFLSLKVAALAKATPYYQGHFSALDILSFILSGLLAESMVNTKSGWYFEKIDVPIALVTNMIE